MEKSCAEDILTCDEKRSPLIFKALTDDSIAEIMPYLKNFRGMSCDYTVGGIFMWIDYFQYRYCIYRDTLFIKSVAEDNRERQAFAQPLGSLPLSEAVDLLREYCKERHIPLEFSAITAFNVEKFIELNPSRAYPLSAWSDYVYTMESLATLSGKKLGKKRNHCNSFARENPDAEFLPITPDIMPEVEECYHTICREAKDSPMAQYEREQVWKVLHRLDKYPFETMCVRSGGKVVAFTVGEVLNNVLHIHIEKSLREVSGAAETINQRFALAIRDKFPEVEWINRQDDAGDEGLRKAKQSYYPAFLLTKYNICFNAPTT